MDKKLPKEQLTLQPHTTYIRISRGNLPGQPNFYRGSIPYRRTIGVESLAKRVAEKRTEYRPETLANAFRLMVDEIYDSIRDGFNVDFALGRTELAVRGTFSGEHAPFDREQHSLQIHLRPSPRLNQLAERIPAKIGSFFENQPIVNEASSNNQPYSKVEAPKPAFNNVKAGSPYLFLYGSRLKLMGDHPDVGIILRRIDTGEEHFFPPQKTLINEATMLCLSLPQDFTLTAGEWEVEIVSQYTPTYHLYKTPRHGYHGFSVVDNEEASNV